MQTGPTMQTGVRRWIQCAQEEVAIRGPSLLLQFRLAVPMPTHETYGSSLDQALDNDCAWQHRHLRSRLDACRRAAIPMWASLGAQGLDAALPLNPLCARTYRSCWVRLSWGTIRPHLFSL